MKLYIHENRGRFIQPQGQTQAICTYSITHNSLVQDHGCLLGSLTSNIYLIEGTFQTLWLYTYMDTPKKQLRYVDPRRNHVRADTISVPVSVSGLWHQTSPSRQGSSALCSRPEDVKTGGVEGSSGSCPPDGMRFTLSGQTSSVLWTRCLLAPPSSSSLLHHFHLWLTTPFLLPTSRGRQIQTQAV